MVGARDRAPYGIGLSSEISAGLIAGGAPHAFLSVFLGIRFSRFPGRLAPRPAASFRPRRKEIYYAHPLPRSRVFPAFFPERGALRAVFAVRPGATRFYCPSCRPHISSISPGRGVLVRCGASRCARAGADQMLLSPTNQASPVPRHSEQLSGRIIRSEIRRRGRRVTIYSSFLPRRDISRFIVAPLL